MGVFNHEFHKLDDLFVEQLQDLYDAEKRLTKALPKLAEAAHNQQLKNAFQAHLQETEGQVKRLEAAFGRLGLEPDRETCEAMKGLIKEGESMASAKGNQDVRDAALIAAAQRVEHYEISGYGTARTFARQLGHEEIARLLEQSLQEESNADEVLNRIAETVNPMACA